MYYWLKCRHYFYRRPIWMLSPASIVIPMWPMLYPSLSIKPYKYFGEQHHSWSTHTQSELPIRIYWLHNSKPFSGWSNLNWICMLRSFITSSSSGHCMPYDPCASGTESEQTTMLPHFRCFHWLYWPLPT